VCRPVPAGALPADILGDHPILLATRIWAVNFTRGPWEAMDLFEASGLKEIDDPSVRPHVLALRPVLLAMMDRFDEALEVGRDCLTHCPTGSAFADITLANVMANQFSVAGQRSESRRLLETARHTQGADFSASICRHADRWAAQCKVAPLARLPLPGTAAA
jgi:LuxR family maltose regulon positive regulatory protein